MSSSVYLVQQISHAPGSFLFQDYPVSSINMSREQTQLTRFTPDSAYGGGGTQTQKTATSTVSSSNIKTQQQIEELQQTCRML